MKMLIPPVLFILCLALMVLLNRYWPWVVWSHAPWKFLGALPILTGLALGSSGWRRFRRRGTTIHAFSEAGTMVTDNIYRRTRNPMYLGLVLDLAGVWVLLGGLSPLLPLLVFVVAVDRWVIRWEEAALNRKFGPEYERYKSRTRRWI
jgi:protein-S-isoprenylcysteine O-methyltransferase Ste14